MPQEIERKFLIANKDYEALISSSYHIKQGYLCRDIKRNVRIRITEEKAYITIKGKSTANGLSRYEWEKEIPKVEAENLFKLCQEGYVEKIRHIVPYQGLVIEIDEFLGNNQDLILAEVELPTTNTPFNPPTFLGKEVSGQKEYYNSYLSEHPFCSW